LGSKRKVTSMAVKIRSMQTNPNGSVVVSLSFPDSELDAFLKWYSANGNGKRRRSPAASRKAVRTRRRNAAAK
jgi:acylphosphatase